ncbi:unnamed protein product [Chrysodeixis includens]|uniref:Fanconi-associated nuclease n=1 Tax=Chrysodeixis includens TaxID=689277 RepID=A0A9P0BTN0_CHRIL|nr:unnamed protein product [Chrysodeixis includens]
MFNSRLLTSYFPVFKSRVSKERITMSAEKNNNQRSLSLKRPLTPKKATIPSTQDVTPTKVPEDKPTQDAEEVVDLISDSEDEVTPPKRQANDHPSKILVLDTSEQEELDVFESPKRRDTPTTSQNNPQASQSSDYFTQTVSPVLNSSTQSTESIVCNVSPSDVWVSPKTPSKPPRTPSKSPSTPSPRSKYFSPNKKRSLTKKSPVKRKLSLPLSSSQGSSNGNKPDDKTLFLLTIVRKFLETESLKCLLETESQELLSKFEFLDYLGMRLVCRLYWYQPGWYNAESVVKITQVDDLLEIIKSLVDCGFIILSKFGDKTVMEFDDYFKILKKPELDEICKSLKIKTSSKQDAVMALKTFSRQIPITNLLLKVKITNKARVLELLQSKAGICYKLSDLARTTLYNLHVLMYLGMDFNILREKKLELLLLNDKTSAETFPVSKDMVLDNASVVFQDKEEFYRYLQAYRLYEDYVTKSGQDGSTESCANIIRQAYEMYRGIDRKQMERYQSLPVWLRKYTAASDYIRIMADGVQVLKRMKTEEHTLAIDILELLISQTTFRTHKKALWYDQEALILQKYLKNPEKAARVLIKGFKSDMAEHLKDAMKPRARLLANQKNIVLEDALRDALRQYAAHEVLESCLPCAHVYRQPIDNHNVRGKIKFTEYTADGKAKLSVEDACLSHYINNEKEFTHGEHWEGDIAVTIFTLLFWDIIYTPPRGVAGVFLSHYQRYPLDMFSPCFYTNRREAIDDRLKCIQEGTVEDVLQMMKRCWDERPETELSDIRRGSGGMSWESVSQVLLCGGPQVAAALCRRLAKDYAYCRSGYPDVTLWNIHTKKLKFLEVKSDSDTPSVKQLQWLKYLLDNGISAGFCYVGVNTTRKQARASDADSLL